MPDWIRSTAMADILGVDFSRLPDDPLYRNLDRLHPHRTTIESALAEREESLFNLGNTILLYDLTSTYFEGKAALIPKAKRAGTSAIIGRTANKSSWGLSSVARGFLAPTRSSRATPRIGKHSPRCSSCLRSAVGASRRRSTSVVDRGMAYAENIAELQRRKLHYLVAARQKERDGYLAEFETAECVRSGNPSTIAPQSASEEVGRAYQERTCTNDEALQFCALVMSGWRRIARSAANKRNASSGIWRRFKRKSKRVGSRTTSRSVRRLGGSRSAILGWRAITH